MMLKHTHSPLIIEKKIAILGDHSASPNEALYMSQLWKKLKHNFERKISQDDFHLYPHLHSQGESSQRALKTLAPF